MLIKSQKHNKDCVYSLRITYLNNQVGVVVIVFLIKYLNFESIITREVTLWALVALVVVVTDSEIYIAGCIAMCMNAYYGFIPFLKMVV